MASVVPYLIVLALALPGLAALRLDRPTVLLLLFFVYYNALHVLSYGQDRFRLPAMPVLFLTAALAVTDLRGGSAPPLRKGRLLLLALLVLAALAVVLPGLVSP
jgi:hypothetical protein